MSDLAAKKRILFVDDDPAILSGLQNLLYRDRKRWDLVFALGGAKALDELRARPFDVVVSDMRMPGIDGAALLKMVQAEYPGTVRIILSGHADRESIVRALPSMHQFLSKPCDPDRLRTAVERCLEVVARPPANIRALIGRLDKLPSPPAIYFELSRLADDPRSSIDAVAKVVTTDPSMAAKVLQLANSAAFGASRKITELPQAITYLGGELLKCLALTSTIFEPVRASDACRLSLDSIQQRALRCATLARTMVLDKKDADVAFAAGLLHDIGEAVLATALPDVFAKIHMEAAAEHEPPLLAERRELGATHAEIGAVLLGMWGLPAQLVDLVAHHHDPSHAPPEHHDIIAVLHIADALIDWEVTRGELAIDRDFLTARGLIDRLDGWCKLVTP